MYSYFRVQNESYRWIFHIYQFQLKIQNRNHIIFLERSGFCCVMYSLQPLEMFINIETVYNSVSVYIFKIGKDLQFPLSYPTTQSGNCKSFPILNI